jgi:two-component system sensor histidine kinase PilS (NtrC family)
MPGRAPTRPGADRDGPRHDEDPRPNSSYWVSLRYFAISRVLLAALLLLFALFGEPARVAGPGFDAGLFLAAAAAYVMLSVVLLAVVGAMRRWFRWQLLGAIATDLVLLTVLMHAAGGTRSGVGVLMVAAVAGAAVLSSPRVAASFAAMATLLLLGDAVFELLDADGTGDSGGGVAVAGLIGAACFATAALISRLASRLAVQEELAARRGEDLDRQLAITGLVIAQLPQGVVVVDQSGEVRSMNRSAQSLLGTSGPWPWLSDLVATRPVAEGSEWETDVDLAAFEPSLAGGSRRIRIRVTRPAGIHRTHAVLLLEDRQQLEERAQQLKLASMGRLSASIAHEIRNPLAAIRHANGLLAEQLTAPPQQRLARIVEDNSVRIDRIVEDVLSIARRERSVLEHFWWQSGTIVQDPEF